MHGHKGNLKLGSSLLDFSHNLQRRGRNYCPFRPEKRECQKEKVIEIGGYFNKILLHKNKIK